MNESHIPNYEPNSAKIKRPNTSVVEIGNEIDYVFIFRKDLDYAIRPVAKSICADYRMNLQSVENILKTEYESFFSEFLDLVQWSHSPRGNVEIHLYDPVDINSRAEQKYKNSNLVSLDPLTSNGVHELAMSREYYFSGKKFIKRIPRPGYGSFEQQISNFSSRFQYKETTILDDDLFKGGSLIEALSLLRNNKIEVKKIIPGIKVGDLDESYTTGINLEPVVEYKLANGKDALSKVNIADPRDYLMGFGGLVVRLPEGGHGRSPYFLPFLPTSDKTGIPKEYNEVFARQILLANMTFFKRVQNLTGKPIKLRHVNPDFKKLMHSVYGFDENVSMQDIVTWSLMTLEKTWKINEKIGLSEEIKDLNMPKKLVFIDVNGTLIDDSPNNQIDVGHIQKMREISRKLQDKGYGIGLCSDSSLDKLVLLSNLLGLNGPTIAENGNTIYFEGKEVVVRKLESLDDTKQLIRNLLNNKMHHEVQDQKPDAFGGSHANYGKGEWCFGAGRKSSVSIYANTEVINNLSIQLKEDNTTIDKSAQNNYLCVHPGNYKFNKAETLTTIKGCSDRVVMIGNSEADWVNRKNGVECGFVAGSDVSLAIGNQSAYLAKSTTINGVFEILEDINAGFPPLVRKIKQFTDGEINKTYLVENEGEDAILQLKNDLGNESLVHLSPYFHSDKLAKLSQINPILQSHGVPTPTIIKSDSNTPVKWVLLEPASGVKLDTIFHTLDEKNRTKVVKNMALMLTRVHSIPTYELSKFLKLTHPQDESKIVSETLEILEQNHAISNRIKLKVSDWLFKNRSVYTTNKRTLVHRDYFQKNIFIDPTQLSITAVIDWGDTSHIGNPQKDVILSAKWISQTTDGHIDKKIFDEFIEFYNTDTENPISPKNIELQLDLYSMQWYLEIALFNLIKNDSQQLNKQIYRIIQITEKYS